MESVEVTEEAVKGMSGPTFYYAEVGCKLSLNLLNFDILICRSLQNLFRSKVKKAQRVRRT